MNRLGARVLPIVLPLLVVFSLYPPRPCNAAAGTSAASFLTIGFGSRAQGLANGVVALADDASATYFNPAGLAGARRELALSHSLWFQDIALSQVAFTSPVRGFNLGLSVTRLGVEGLEARTAETARPDGTFGAEDLSVSASLARRLGRGAAGAGVKLIQQRIAGTTGRSVAVDLGGRIPINGRIDAGLSVRNIGPPLKLGGASYPLPLSFHAGLAYKSPLTLVFEAGRYRDGHNELNAGTEYWLNDSFILRGGYFHQLGTGRASGGRADGALPFAGMSAGFGLRLGDKLSMDYAIVPFQDLGSAHRVTLGIRF